jgi:hypothetical protein
MCLIDRALCIEERFLNLLNSYPETRVSILSEEIRAWGLYPESPTVKIGLDTNCI